MSYTLKDVRNQIIGCWNILKEISSLNEAVLENNMDKDKIFNILLGLKDLYQSKFEKLDRMSNQNIFDKEFEEYMLDCWQVVDDIYLIAEYMDEEMIENIQIDDISNLLMGLSSLYKLKFKKLWKHYVILIDNDT